MKLKKTNIKAPDGSSYVLRYSRWFSPYVQVKGRRRTTLPFITAAKCGVYVIRSRQSKETLYVGYSGHNLYKTLYRHFQSWEDPSQVRFTYKNPGSYEVMVFISNSCNLTPMLEQYYIHKLQPRDGVRKLELPLEEISFRQMPPMQIMQDNALPKVLEDWEVPV